MHRLIFLLYGKIQNLVCDFFHWLNDVIQLLKDQSICATLNSS